MKKIMSFLLFITTAIVLQAQQPHCMTYEKMQEFKAADPLLGEQLRIAKTQIDDYYNDPANFSSRAGIITIPVVFHVMHTGQAVGTLPNVSDAQLISQITQLNKDYRRLNTDTSLIPGVWKNTAADCEIEFCLASVDASGNPTTGITRHNMGASGTWNESRKASTTWDRNKYLNIWIATIGGGTLGYTLLPGGPANTDGVVIDPLYIGVGGSTSAPFNKGRTATHEIGHWLGLDHTWGDDGTACTGTDGIEDTPNQAGQNFGCPSFPHTDACSPSSPGVMYMDYMDYTDDACMFMFTKAQKNKMLSVLNTARNSIKSSNGCSPVTNVTISGVVNDAVTSAPVIAAKVYFEGETTIETSTNASGVFTVTVRAGNYNVYAGKWGYMTNQFSNNESYTTNISGMSIPIENFHYYDDFSLKQGWITSGSATSGTWIVDYPIEARTGGGVTSQTGHSLTNDLGSRCFMTGNGSYGGSSGANDVDGGTTILTSPPMDLTAYQNPYISYYRWFYGSTSDDEKFKLNDGSATSVLETVTYTGSQNAWTERKIRVLDFGTLSANMTFSVEVTDGGSSSTVEGALDKFMVFDSAQSGIVDQKEFRTFNIYPTPAKDILNIVYRSGTSQFAELKIFNAVGELVLNQSIRSDLSGATSIDISSFSSGMYMIELNDQNYISRRKLIKQE